MRQLLLSLLFFLSALANAQRDSIKTPAVPTHFFELGINANAYKGDLNHSYQKFTSAVSFGVKFNTQKRINPHIGLIIGSITAQNPNFQTNYYSGPDSGSTPNAFVKTTFWQLNFDLQLNLIKKKYFVLYFSQGIGMFHFNPKDENGNSLVNQLNTRAPNEVYSQVAVSFPTSLGFQYLFKNYVGAGFQAGWLNTKTYYLDNIHQLGNRNTHDNILFYRFLIYIPLTFK